MLVAIKCLVPSSPPENVEVLSLDSTSFKVSWQVCDFAIIDGLTGTSVVSRLLLDLGKHLVPCASWQKMVVSGVQGDF